MLVLSRKVEERIRIAEDIVVVVTAIQGDRIKIGIEAPKSVRVLRGELLNKDHNPGVITQSGQ
jgi:carbon storage regulator